jgi:pimeloyl-ACP methyl ester carboxylesterase
MNYETKFYNVRGLKLAYHEWGRVDAPVILFFHGFLDHGLSFAPVAEVLAQEFRVMAVDARGHGHSDWAGEGGYYHFADYFHDVAVLIESLGIESFHLIGHSMGGSIATGVAAMHGTRVESVVMLEGMGPPDEAFDDLPDRLKRWHKALQRDFNRMDRQGRKNARKAMDNVELASKRLSGLNSRLPEERALRFAKTFTEPSISGEADEVVWRYDPLHRSIGSRPFRFEEAQHLWRAIDAPVLSLWGKESGFRPEQIERRHACLSDVQAGFIHEASHNIHHDQPEVVSRVIHAWVSGRREIEADGFSGCDVDLGE